MNGILAASTNSTVKLPHCLSLIICAAVHRSVSDLALLATITRVSPVPMISVPPLTAPLNQPGTVSTTLPPPNTTTAATTMTTDSSTPPLVREATRYPPSSLSVSATSHTTE